jgi:hypothetical protein
MYSRQRLTTSQDVTFPDSTQVCHSRSLRLAIQNPDPFSKLLYCIISAKGNIHCYATEGDICGDADAFRPFAMLCRAAADRHGGSGVV